MTSGAICKVRAPHYTLSLQSVSETTKSRCHEFPPSRSDLDTSLRGRWSNSKVHWSQVSLYCSKPKLSWTTDHGVLYTYAIYIGPILRLQLTGGPEMQACMESSMVILVKMSKGRTDGDCRQCVIRTAAQCGSICSTCQQL